MTAVAQKSVGQFFGNLKKAFNLPIVLGIPLKFVIGDLNADHIEIQVLSYEYQDIDDGWDANWLICRMLASSSARKLEIRAASLTTYELIDLKKGLEALIHNREDGFTFQPIEPYLVLEGERADGGFVFRGDLNLNFDKYFKFMISSDIDKTLGAIKDLERILELFPARKAT